jgi:hypothetical protein
VEVLNEVWDGKKSDYNAMYHRHKYQWNIIRDFIEDHDIESIFEVGGGTGFMGAYAKKYLNVDLNKTLVNPFSNKRTHQFVNGDFEKIDASNWIGEYDLVLICGVVDHIGSYETAIMKAISLKPRFIIVSFFMKLQNGEKDVRCDRCGNILTMFSLPKLTRFMDSLHVGYEIVDLHKGIEAKTNSVLLIVELIE